jgi:glycosyltransferase involved in cell wall biosynthesis/ribosomal protein S18 acetylase RimI-like enzyme
MRARRREGMSRARPLVVHVTTTDMSLELLLGPQLERLRAAGFDVIGASAPGPFVARLEQRGVRHVGLRHATRRMAPGEDLRALAELVDLFRTVRPDIVHTHNPKPGLYGRMAARLARVPAIVNTVHGLYAVPEDRRRKRALVYSLERVAAACSHAELLQNEEDLPVLRRLGVPAERLTILGNGIDLRRFDPDAVTDDDVSAARRALGARDDDIVVGVVGRLVREKGYPEVFQAATDLRTRAPNVRVAVIGPDEHDKADGLTLDDRALAASAGVRFLGERDDVVPLYRAMDVLVLASHREGFPRAPMEAAAMGVPVIATDIRGCRQTVDHGVTGLLVPPRDPAALAAAITALAADATLRRRMGAAGRRKAEREFDQQRCVDVTVSVYDRLLARAGRARHPTAGMVRPARLDDVAAIVGLHTARIGDGFLVSLGPRFLERLYRRLIRSRDAFVLVADHDQHVGGFVAVADDTGGFYREFLLRDGVPATAAALGAMAQAPGRVWETLRYGTGSSDDLPRAEVLAIAVAEQAEGRGVGGALVAAAQEQLRQRGIGAARVVTAADNAAALRMYERAGFHPKRRTEVHAGTPQEVLVWR